MANANRIRLNDLVEFCRTNKLGNPELRFLLATTGGTFSYAIEVRGLNGQLILNVNNQSTSEDMQPIELFAATRL